MNAARKNDVAGGEPSNYEAAVAELERILSTLDGNSVDVDALAEQVRRASFLISWCRDRIESAQLEINTITSDVADDE